MKQANVAGRSAGRRWLIPRVLSIFAGRRPGLINVSDLPARFTMPLRRDGLDPVQLSEPDADTTSVRSIGHILGINVWLVTDYEQARAVLNDAGYSTDIRPILGGKRGKNVIGGLGFTDPPDHTALRKILMPEFTARRLAAMLPTIERIVEQQLDVAEAAGPVTDLVATFASVVPFQVISEMLGVPATDSARFARLGHNRFDVNQGGAGIFGALSDSLEFMRETVGKQRQDPGTGIIAGMLRNHGDTVDDTTIAGLADGVFTGGYETSASMLALGTLALIRTPDLVNRIRADESAVDGVVDELLRYLSVVQIAFPRFARRDLDLSGQRIRAGDVVVCSLTRANRDDVFGAQPDQLDPTRGGPAHLAFGSGFHRCIGAELARMQLRVAFRALIRRFPDLELAIPPDDLEFHELSIVYGLRALPVRLHATEPATVSPGRSAEREHL